MQLIYPLSKLSSLLPKFEIIIITEKGGKQTEPISAQDTDVFQIFILRVKDSHCFEVSNLSTC